MKGSYITPPVPQREPPNPRGRGDLIYPSTPPRDPVLILVFNLIFCVIGYFIIGQWQKSIVAIVAAVAIGWPTCGFGLGALTIATAIDGFMQAQQLQAGYPVTQWTFFKDHR